MGLEITKEDKDHVLKLFPEIEWIADRGIREGVITAWVRAWRGGGWDRLENAPLMIKEIRDPKVGVLHVRVSAQLTRAIADIVEREMGQPLNRDHLIAGAILHDVGKPLEYAPDGQGPLSGEQLRHPVSGAHLVLEAFPLRDLAFEYDPETIAVIIPDKHLDHCLREAKDFQKRSTSSRATAPIWIGLSARNGRLVSSSRLLSEAAQALKQAEASTVGRIVAFRADPDKYRAAIAARSASGGRSR